MANTKISAATSAGALDGTEEIPLAKIASGTAYRTTTQDIADLALTGATFAALDLSGLPTADPGGGKVWLNGGVLQVGP